MLKGGALQEPAGIARRCRLSASPEITAVTELDSGDGICIDSWATAIAMAVALESGSGDGGGGGTGRRSQSTRRARRLGFHGSEEEKRLVAA